MFEGRLIEDEPDHVRIEAASSAAPIYVDHGISAAPGATVWAAIRPGEDRHRRATPPADARQLRGAWCEDIAYMGDVSVYLVKLDSGKIVRVTQPNVERRADERITWDEKVWLSWDAASPVVVTQ